MIKQLLSCAAFAALALNINAAEVTLWEGDVNLGTAWSESFAVPAGDLAVLNDESAVLNLEYTLDSECTYWQYKPVSNSEGWAALEVAVELGNSYQCISVDAGSTSTTLPLGAKDIENIKANGLRFQGYGMTFKKITYNADAEIDPNTLWEGEYTITGWNNGAEFASFKVKAGDVLCYEFSEAGAANAQVIVKGSDWANLLGTEKITHADMATGKVYVGVTQEMLDNCGGKIFVQGDGGCVLNKVSIVDSFDPEGVIAYGERIPGVSVFTVIPEDTKEIAVVYSAKPSWSQICKSDDKWTNFELAYTESSDGSVITYTLTPEAIEAINAKKEFIINADNTVNVEKVYIPAGNQSGIDAIVAGEDANAPVNVYNFAGQQVRANVLPAEATDGLAPGFYIVGNKKVLVK